VCSLECGPNASLSVAKQTAPDAADDSSSIHSSKGRLLAAHVSLRYRLSTDVGCENGENASDCYSSSVV
jgi:hypothetical protein